ncbi:MAG: hypothetical protein GXY03_05885 [Solirubrobacterales bacterium]|nr:hypothetical protein [Solirubrobacterales bacterium]
MELLEDPDKRAGLIVLAGFVLSFVFIRISTRLMRNPKVTWWPGSIKTGGVHVHHLVFGIGLMIVAGFLGFAVEPVSPWVELMAALFGVGVGLTVDEFALWLYLEDVYWTKEGRASVDVALVTGALGGIVLIVGAPVDTEESLPFLLLGFVIHLAWGAVVLLKGKIRLAVLGFFIPLLYTVAAIRLARPNSPWARRRYAPGSAKLARAQVRADRWDDRRERWIDRIGGAPHLERAEKAIAAVERAES